MSSGFIQITTPDGVADVVAGSQIFDRATGTLIAFLHRIDNGYEITTPAGSRITDRPAISVPDAAAMAMQNYWSFCSALEEVNDG